MSITWFRNVRVFVFSSCRINWLAIVSESSQMIVHSTPCLRSYLHKRDNLFVRFSRLRFSNWPDNGAERACVIFWPPQFLDGVISNLIKHNRIINQCAEKLFRLDVGKILEEKMNNNQSQFHIWKFWIAMISSFFILYKNNRCSKCSIVVMIE